MVLLAERLKEHNIVIKRPLTPGISQSISVPIISTADTKHPPLRPNLLIPDPSVTPSASSPRKQSSTMLYPRTPERGFSSPDAVSIANDHSGICNQDSTPLSHPMCIGKFKKTCYDENGKFLGRVTHIECRLLIDNFVTVSDLVFEWVDLRQLKIRRAHPMFMQQVDQQQDFVVDEDGAPKALNLLVI